MPAVRPRTLITRAAATIVAAVALAIVTAPAAGASEHVADPPGNNGTVKVDGLDLFDGPGHTEAPNEPDATEPDNDPHLTCGFQLEFFGFDEDQVADVVLTAHPPTGEGAVVLERRGELISDDAAGGGPNDVDATIDVAVDELDAAGFTSVHDQHGWHVKLTVEVFEADGVTRVPGGVKHKVFWLEPCAPTTPEVPDDTGGEIVEVCPDGTPMTDVDGDGVAELEDCETPVVVLPEVTPIPTPTPTPTPLPPAPAAPEAPAPAPPAPSSPAPAPAVDVIGGEVVRDAGAPAPALAAPTVPETEVLGVQVVRELPRTGSSTVVLAGVGGLLLLAGAAMSSAGRRRAHLLAPTTR